MVKRKSAKKKTEMVMELLRGIPIEEVSRNYQVTVADLSAWSDPLLALKRFFKGWIRFCQGCLREEFARWRRHLHALDGFCPDLIFAFKTIDGALENYY